MTTIELIPYIKILLASIVLLLSLRIRTNWHLSRLMNALYFGGFFVLTTGLFFELNTEIIGGVMICSGLILFVPYVFYMAWPNLRPKWLAEWADFPK